MSRHAAEQIVLKSAAAKVKKNGNYSALKKLFYLKKVLDKVFY